jgi:hypothetical protein
VDEQPNDAIAKHLKLCFLLWQISRSLFVVSSDFNDKAIAPVNARRLNQLDRLKLFQTHAK